MFQDQIKSIDNIRWNDNLHQSLNQMFTSDKVAVIASKLQIAAEYKNKDLYCLSQNEQIMQYPIALFVKIENPFQLKLNKIIQNIFESGIIEHWRNEMIRKFVTMAVDNDPVPLRMEHELGIFVILFIGFTIALMVFCFEQYIFVLTKKTNLSNRQKRIIIFIDKFLDSKRHFYVLIDNPLGKADNYDFSICSCKRSSNYQYSTE